MKKRTVILWAVFAAVLVFMIVSPHQNIKLVDITNTFQGPSPEHWLGTDNMGRDLYSLMITGGIRTLIVVLLATAISFTLGTLLGMIAAFEGGVCQSVIQFVSDFTTIIPSFIVALILSAMFGFSPVMAGVLFGVGNMGQYVNMASGLTLSMKERDFISAEISLGLTNPRIIFFHILPNIVKQMFVYLGNNASAVTLQYAGLAFIGLGTDVTNPDWGTLLYTYRQYMIAYPWLVIIPIAAVCLLALFFHFAFDSGGTKREELTIYD